MAENDDPKVRTLDAVVVEALEAITRRVYHRRKPQLWERFRRYFSMLESESRDSTIATFEHLKHGGYEFPPFLVRRWAIANGWKKMDAQLLDDYAAGVLAGVKYHHADPMGRNAIETWQRDADGKPPWVDPGRPGHGTPLTRR
ncbi:MAG: hypothetical protein HIU84_09065 [Acidobacteria bacterium]|nr:hypothetical protein [Acidobacteriota bacterium]